jgi:hypothetical protein
MLIDEENGEIRDETKNNGREYDMAIAVFGLSMAALIPALIMYARIVRKEDNYSQESE